MTSEIIKEFTATKDTSEVTSKQALAWAQRVDAQRSQIAMLATIQETKEMW